MKNKDLLRIAIDGPGGAGKSTIAKKVAKILELDYVDTGAMYRAISLKLNSLNISPEETGKIEFILNKTDIDFSGGKVFLDGKNVDTEIRTAEISMLASLYSAVPEVREKLVNIQRRMGERKSLIMDGRDIGTNVLPDAELKIFMTATAEERAKRRFKELSAKGEKTEFHIVLKDIKKRDAQDMNRVVNPLKSAEDAVVLDTTFMSEDEVTEFIVKEAQRGNFKTF